MFSSNHCRLCLEILFNGSFVLNELDRILIKARLGKNVGYLHAVRVCTSCKDKLNSGSITREELLKGDRLLRRNKRLYIHINANDRLNEPNSCFLHVDFRRQLKKSKDVDPTTGKPIWKTYISYNVLDKESLDFIANIHYEDTTAKFDEDDVIILE